MRLAIGGRYAGRGYHELSRQTNYEWASLWTRPSETLHLVERFTRINADNTRIQDHRRGSDDVFEALDGNHSISRLADDTQI